VLIHTSVTFTFKYKGGVKMQKLILILALLTLADRACAQQTRREVTSTATTTINDSKANSDTVPDGVAISGQFERVVVLRFKYLTDLLTGLESMMKQQKIHNAVILSGIGSVRNYQYHLVSNRTFPSKSVYVTDPTAPADIVNLNGYVINGRVHAHVTLADADKAFGGHLETGTNVFTFAIVTIGVLSDSVDLSRVDDSSYR
jgi:predicted DNA-binding protein with PD1-like motif